jgi:hypothetical protein
MSTTKPDSIYQAGDRAEWLEVVRQHVASLRYGVVQIVVHDSQVTQVEKTERTRFDQSRPPKKLQASKRGTES